ncbi:MAG: helix-turn-helix transcriptional regulator [Bacteroidia bacterium]|nr:helix-turn-helix transcriptional regulator [Bacteroidia bacterium]
MNENEDIGANLKKVREKLYKTQDAFSIASDISREYISKVESNKSDPSLSTLRKMAKSLDKPTYLLVKEILGE